MPKLIPRKSVMVCNLSATPARYEEQSATIRPSSDLIKRPFQTRAGFKVGQSLSGLHFVADHNPSTTYPEWPRCVPRKPDFSAK
jgi:hypothetical protein